MSDRPLPLPPAGHHASRVQTPGLLHRAVRQSGAFLLLLALAAGLLPGSPHGPAASTPAGHAPVLGGIHPLQAPILPAQGGSGVLADLLSAVDPRGGPTHGPLATGALQALVPARGSITPAGPSGIPAGLPPAERLARAGLLSAMATAVPPPHSD